MPFNEDASVSIICVNENQNEKFRGSPQWRSPNGNNVGTRNQVVATLEIARVTRHQAGTYTCHVPGVLEISAAKYHLVIHCKLYIICK